METEEDGTQAALRIATTRAGGDHEQGAAIAGNGRPGAAAGGSPARTSSHLPPESTTKPIAPTMAKRMKSKPIIKAA